MDNKLQIYESLLNEATSLEKECGFIYIEYIREYGDEINHIFSLKIESIKLKKKIAYCVKRQNTNQEINLEEMEKEINKTMQKYQKDLNAMIEEKKAIDKDKGKAIGFENKRNIKLMYYKIVHLIHPDLHPELQRQKKIKELWQISVDAYKRNDEKTLKRAYEQILMLVNSSTEIILKNIDEKIDVIRQEIQEIKENNPYQFKHILNDEEEKLELHKKHHEEEDYYLNYNQKLLEQLSQMIKIKEEKCEA